MGWDSVAVSKAAEGHAAKEAKELQAAQKVQEDGFAKMHTGYLNTLKPKKGAEGGSPGYIHPLAAILSTVGKSKGNGQIQHDMSLDIRQAEEPGGF